MKRAALLVGSVAVAMFCTGGASADEHSVASNQRSVKPPFVYRSISFSMPLHLPPTGSKRGEVPPGAKLDIQPGVLELAAKVGFNDVTIQTWGGTLNKMAGLRQWADQTGNFKLAKSLGMTLTVWVHEFQDWDKSIGPLEINNESLWKAMSTRYRQILTKTLPEIDYLVLTVVETQVNAAQDPKLLAKLVEVINNECRAADKRLILRSFVWHPQEMKVFLASLANLPKDVIIQSKCVPQDWHLRGSDNPVIGAMGGREEQVEFDIGGEYFKLDYVACAFTDILESQLKYAAAHGVKGIAVRFDRLGHTAYGQAQEANLWFMGYWASGKSPDPMVAWKDYATATFGAKAAPIMIEALKPTGQVIAEALCVERETFGDARALVPAMREGVQAIRS